MMTFKELKKLVKLPLYKEQRVPTVKALEESGVSVVAEKILENHGSISVYQNGYVICRAHKRVTVFSLRNCVHYKYDALEGAGHHIEEEEFDEYEWHIRLILEGEDRIFMNYEIIQGKWMPSREDREYKEEILEGVDEAVSTLERMISEERWKNCRIGGEQSGHIIFSKYASTGDGILTSLKMMEVMLAKKKPLSELAAPLKIYPQVLENVRVTDKKAAQNDPAVQEAVNKVAEALGDTGRILVRESGTEPVVRVMVEAPDHDTCQKYVDEVVHVICERGYKA